MSVTITTPVGRLVQGNLYKGSDKDADGKQKVFKTGAKAGQPRTDFYFALAVPKGNETHWNQTEWGKVIESVGKAAFPQGWQRPDFSWKITDGDSTVFNTGTPPRRPCDFEGFPGNWILRFTRPFAPKVYNADGSQLILEEDYINLGDYIQVHALIVGNQSTQRPGVYLNHLMVAFTAYGERIFSGADPKAVGFGEAPLPVGALTTPQAQFSPAVSSSDNVPMSPPVPTPTAAPQPYPQILAPKVRVMSPAANGLTYEQYIAAGWTDEQLISNGLLLN